MNEFAKWRFRRYLNAMRTDDDMGGYLVPPDFIINYARKRGADLPVLPEYEEMRAALDARPRWWRWLFRSYGKVAQFVVYIWPRVPEIDRLRAKWCMMQRKQREAEFTAALVFCIRQWKAGGDG